MVFEILVLVLHGNDLLTNLRSLGSGTVIEHGLVGLSHLVSRLVGVGMLHWDHLLRLGKMGVDGLMLDGLCLVVDEA